MGEIKNVYYTISAEHNTQLIRKQDIQKFDVTVLFEEISVGTNKLQTLVMNIVVKRPLLLASYT